ncbi:MAG: GSCFA domain-containing protein, partial [Melioribacteraceae bacterium]|nr:GSCFA domain-containing protein [Melioribacteraceae bacterium]
MMKRLRTTAPEISYPFRIAYNHKITCLGSCFTENIGLLLSQHKFDVLTNPFGILYNPFSILKCIERITQKSWIAEKDVIERDGL